MTEEEGGFSETIKKIINTDNTLSFADRLSVNVENSTIPATPLELFHERQNSYLDGMSRCRAALLEELYKEFKMNRHLYQQVKELTIWHQDNHLILCSPQVTLGQLKEVFGTSPENRLGDRAKIDAKHSPRLEINLSAFLKTHPLRILDSLYATFEKLRGIRAESALLHRQIGEFLGRTGVLLGPELRDAHISHGEVFSGSDFSQSDIYLVLSATDEAARDREIERLESLFEKNRETFPAGSMNVAPEGNHIVVHMYQKKIVDRKLSAATTLLHAYETDFANTLEMGLADLSRIAEEYPLLFPKNKGHYR